MDTGRVQIVSKLLPIAALVCLTACGKPGRSPFTISAPSKPAPVQAESPAPGVAPEPNEVVAKKGPELLPLEAGNSWEMKATSGDELHKLALRAIGEQERGGIKASFVETRLDGNLVDSQGYVVDDKAIRLAVHGPDGKDRIDPPMPVMKLPPKAGESWTWKGKYVSMDGAASGTGSFTVSGPEKVSTGTGEYDAWRVDGTLTLSAAGAASVLTNTQWFAPGIGLVKQLTISEGEQDRLAVLTASRVQKP